MLRKNTGRIKSKVKKKMSILIFKFCNLGKKRFECPICDYRGPFVDITPNTGLRKHAKCPQCNAVERHRLQFLAVNYVLRDIDASNLKMLHCAPEPFFYNIFSKKFGQYESADLIRRDVDHNIDLQRIPFADATYDFVFASHVLEHIHDDKKAISEIRRILKPKGMAILPIPVIAEKTIEYPKPNPKEHNHVRAPGMDYFDRFEEYFSKVERFSSNSFPEKFQLFIYEDRSKWPTEEYPLRIAMSGERHIDIVPVCHV